jgi:hypothetical protein
MRVSIGNTVFGNNTTFFQTKNECQCASRFLCIYYILPGPLAGDGAGQDGWMGESVTKSQGLKFWRKMDNESDVLAKKVFKITLATAILFMISVIFFIL